MDNILEQPARGLTFREAASVLLVTSQDPRLLQLLLEHTQHGEHARLNELGVAESKLCNDGDMSSLYEWAYSKPPGSFGPGGDKGWSFKYDQLDHPGQNLTCIARSLLRDALAEWAAAPLQKRGASIRCTEAQSINTIIIFKTMFKMLFMHAGHDPENPDRAGCLQVGVDSLFVNALGSFSVHGGTVA
jgi:hypothetical protein